jgi:long-chain acyl-CoA synthetase
MSRPEAGPETLVDIFRRAVAAEKPDLLNVRRDGAWRAISSRALENEVRAAALGLSALGIGEFDRVGLLSENRPEWTIADLATLSLGAADVPIYATQTPRQVAYILNDAGIEVLFISGRAQYERLAETLISIPRLRAIIAFDRFEAADPRLLAYADLLARGRDSDPAHFEALSARVTPDHLATLIYTSGTTGDPKGVMLTHANIVSNVKANVEIIPLDASSIVLSFLPLSHSFERTAFYLFLHCRATIYYAQSVEAVAADLAEVRPHFMTSVPRLFEKIYARAMDRAGGGWRGRISQWAVEVGREWAARASRGRPIDPWLAARHRLADRLVFAKWRAALGGRIRYLISGGAPLSIDLAEVFYAAGMPILQGYGLTESSPVITANRPDANRLGSVGRPVAGVKVRINPDGEILCAGPNVMRGYYNRPAETAAALEEVDGVVWLHTGDIGHLDEDGYLYITDRKKDLLKTSGGKYIAPQPIENAIRQSRFVSQVVVIGDDRKFPSALIVPEMNQLRSYAAHKGIAYRDPSELLSDPRVLDLFERQVAKFTSDLAPYERIKAIALLPSELTVESGELTPTLKVRRRHVVEKYKALIDHLYAQKEELSAARR